MTKLQVIQYEDRALHIQIPESGTDFPLSEREKCILYLNKKVAELEKDLNMLSYNYMTETHSLGRELLCQEIRRKHGLGQSAELSMVHDKNESDKDRTINELKADNKIYMDHSAEMEAKLVILENKLKVAFEALSFYADTNSWLGQYGAYGEIDRTDTEEIKKPWGNKCGGKAAREALKRINGGEG